MSDARSDSIPLVPDGNLDRVVLLDGDQRWTVADVLASAQELQESLGALPGPVKHLVNLAGRRDQFLVGLVAGILGAQVSLMPSTRSRGAIRDLLADHPNTVILHDGDQPLEPTLTACAPQVAIPPLRQTRSQAEYARQVPQIPRIPRGQLIARVFTSGTTGKPRGHDKHWGRLVANTRVAADALDVHHRRTDNAHQDRLVGIHLLGTVPSQHMYGFESLILAALCGGATLSVDQPFFPGDIAASLAALPSPRMLVTTPYHLHHLLASDCALPPCEHMLCATAPLEPRLAARAEQTLGGALQEIYGSTETGQIAVRQPTQGADWRLMEGVDLEVTASGEVIASGGHVERPVALADCIERVDARRFRLIGRLANQVNIAGKRSSIEYLNATLRAIDGVEDGLFFRPRSAGASDGQPERLAAVVRGPGLTADAIRRALRDRLDPVFLPRPLLLVDQMPVNATGKITRDALDTLLTDSNDSDHQQRDAS
ncbi:AMP-binding protein [Guyparkeria halophila]|uniref:AMP-binding protein n=1 Tax=Guyparkeria halophila TaxID=47960 RepID=A0ABZ0YVE0_9GAMM|nr:AMP-binding protein [Guyparkeria halophila]WQH15334.1 AMP-binding protein [Guyparkeria halophila]